MAQQDSEDKASKKERRRKRRWGAVAAPAAAASTGGAAPGVVTPAADATTASTPSGAVGGDVDAKKAKILAMQESIKARLAAAKQQQGATAAAAAPPAAASDNNSSLTAAEKVKAMQASIQARLQAVKAQQAVGGVGSATMASTGASSSATDARPAKRAKHFELDMSVTGPTFQKASETIPGSSKTANRDAKANSSSAPKKKVNPYLAHTAKDDEKETETMMIDDRVGRASKERVRNKVMKFVEPGTFQKMAERRREKAAKAQESGYISGRKAGHTVQSAGLADIYGDSSGTAAAVEETVETLAPRWDAHPDTKMPLAVEWWDVELLPSKLKKKVAAAESLALSKQSKAALQALDGDEEKDGAKEEESSEDLRALCFNNAKLSYSKTSELVQHIVPIKPPNAYTGPPKEAVMHLTKKEQRRQRKLRRRETQREQQDLQAAGLLPAPEPRLTLQNFIRVLGDQAYVDPSQMEKKVMQQMEARKQAHNERNEAKKLTKEQRAAKRAKKLEEDTSQGVQVAVFFVKDMSHPYHRAKVDLNAQQYNISGAVVESQNPSMACVVVEGGPKAIKKYIRLMTVRMKWTGPDDESDSDDEEDNEAEKATQKFNPENTCELVWEGMVVKRLFNGFMFQSCETPDQARKVLKTKGVAHYWDQVAASSSGQSTKLGLRVANDSDDEDNNPFKTAADDDEDVVMQNT